ncbi:hypothetical protein MMC17_007161 [Xylographa soralifera]|nr:hypothetical protein [Xylographa soralifera]
MIKPNEDRVECLWLHPLLTSSVVDKGTYQTSEQKRPSLALLLRDGVTTSIKIDDISVVLSETMIPSKPIAHVALTCLSVCSLVQGVALTNDNYYGITIGSPFELTWSGDGTPVNITLVDGSPANVIPVAAIAINAPSPSYLWTPSASIPIGEYALAIIQSGSTNYAGPFFIYDANSQSSPPSTSSTSVATGLVTPASTTSSAMDLAVPTPSSTSSSSMSVVTTSNPTTSGAVGGSLGFAETGARTGMGAPYPTGTANGTWMGNATVGVGAVTVTEDCGCVEETGGVSAGYEGTGEGGGSVTSSTGSGRSASSSGAPFKGGAGWGRADGTRVGLIGGALVIGVVAWMA